ncbi:MAG: hypothetical protein R2838_03455 [Caldilineaceae bacterium]
MADSAPRGELFHADDLVYWLPGLIMGIVILWTLRRRSHFLLMPALILGSLGLFYLVITLLGVTPATAMANGWLLGPLPSGQLWEPAALLAVLEALVDRLPTSHAQRRSAHRRGGAAPQCRNAGIGVGT